MTDVKSLKKKKSKQSNNSPRQGPEGDSINQNRTKFKMQSVKSPKKIKLQKSPKHSSDSENMHPQDSISSLGNKKRKSRDVEDEEDMIYSVKKQRAEDIQDTPRKKKSPKKKQSSTSSEDSIWERAVEKARGLPDGSNESTEEDSFFNISDPNSPSKQLKNNEDASNEKKSEKKKSMKVLHTAAKKLKKLGTGKAALSPKGTKRKRSASGEDDRKTDGSKDEELNKKERKKQRKMTKNNYELSCQAKSLWSKLRQHNLSEEDRHRLSGELLDLVKGKAKELIFSHDTSRVIQCLMKYGTQDHKTVLFEELREHIIAMARSKYAKFFVRKLLKYGTKAQRHYVFRKFYGNVRKLIKHQEAAELVELAYNEYAQAPQRAALVEEFYGPSYALFKTDEARTLDKIIKEDPEKRDSILRNMKEALTSLMDKNISTHSIVHRVLLEYFTYAPDKQKAEMIEIVRDNIIHMLHTRDGARVAMHCIWYGTTKDRKVIVKSFKTFISKICKEEYGHMVLLCIFDCVDDTKLVQKAILEEMMKSMKELVLEKYGRKVIMYLLSPRDPQHFCPDIVKVLQTGDGNPYSKKDMALRRRELLEVISEPILNYLTENTKELVMNNAAILMITAILHKATGDQTKAMMSIASIAAEPFVAGDLENYHIIEHAAGHMVIKKLILKDSQLMKENQDVVFSKILVDTVGPQGLKSWAACNRGCFTLLSLLQLNHPVITTTVKSALVGIKKSLLKMDFKGAQLLSEKLQ